MRPNATIGISSYLSKQSSANRNEEDEESVRPHLQTRETLRQRDLSVYFVSGFFNHKGLKRGQRWKHINRQRRAAAPTKSRSNELAQPCLQSSSTSRHYHFLVFVVTARNLDFLLLVLLPLTSFFLILLLQSFSRLFANGWSLILLFLLLVLISLLQASIFLFLLLLS